MKTSCFIFVFLFSLLGTAQQSELFDKATVAYNDGAYEQAAENYLKILESGVHSAALYYNLGNAYYKLNKVAPSIYYYEKALLLAPNDTEIKNNLTYAQNMTLDAIQKLPETAIARIYGKIIVWLSFDQWAYVAVLFTLLFAVAYMLFYYLRYASQKRIAFIASMVFVIGALAALGLAYLRFTEVMNENPAIVFAEEIAVKSEPNERSQEVFVLHEGTKVNILEELNNWQRIEIADGKSGWASKEDIKALKDF